MPRLRGTLSNRSGQVLLIAIGLGLVLLIGMAAVFFITQVGTIHQTASNQRTGARSVAEEGLAYMTQELSASSTTWQNALNGSFTTDCNSGNFLSSPSGGHFKVYCSTGAAGNSNMQDYQVAVTIVASRTAGNGTETSLRAIQAYMSQRTLGADLAAGVHAAAALQMMIQPSIAGALDVEWGPIVCMDPNPWPLDTGLDADQYPRKFSAGWIYGNTYPRSGPSGPMVSDQKEFWSQSSFTDVPLPDEAYYIQQAQTEPNNIAQPMSKNSILAGSPQPIVATCTGPNLHCGYFGPPNLAPGDTAVFGNASLYSLSGSPVIYVDGWAEFDQIAIDSATVIVTGQTTLANSSGGNSRNLHVPWTAPSEYPYATSWFCQGNQGANCPTSVNIQFRGFLYVKGDLVVATSGWTMAGVLWVGDPQVPPLTNWNLQIASGDSLTLYYDDEINHSLHFSPVGTSAIKIEPDLQQDAPTF